MEAAAPAPAPTEATELVPKDEESEEEGGSGKNAVFTQKSPHKNTANGEEGETDEEERDETRESDGNMRVPMALPAYGKRKYYVVVNGKGGGAIIHDSWATAGPDSISVSGCIHKGFSSWVQAQQFMVDSGAVVDLSVSENYVTGTRYVLDRDEAERRLAPMFRRRGKGLMRGTMEG